MANTFYPSNDAEFAIWLANFVAKAAIYQTELGLTQTELDKLEADLLEFNAGLNLKQQKKEESIAQTAFVRGKRKNINTDIGLFNNKLKSISGLASNIVEEIGFNVDDNSLTKVTPNTPNSLVVTGTSDGINHLKWNRAGNRQGTMFVIEAKIGTSESWTIINTVTSARLEHINQTPGVKATYRVKAKRGDLESGYSNVALVYG